MAATMEPQRCGWRLAALLTLIPLAGGCGDDDVTAPISNATTSTVSATTVAPTTTIPPTTTIAAATTTEVVIPEGALDLGHGVFVPVPDGWEGTVEDGLGNLEDGTVWFSVQVLERLPGEDPALLTQEYIDTFDTDFPLLSYSPTRFVWNSGVDPVVHRYDMHYATFDPADSTELYGGISLFARADGLSMVIDVYTYDFEERRGLPTQEYGQLLDSFLAAPVVDEMVDLTARDPFRVDSIHPTAMVDDLIGFTLAPEFEVWDSGEGYVQASNGDMDMEVFALTEIADFAEAGSLARSLVGERYSGVAFGEITEESDWRGWQRQAIGWSGTYTTDGEASTGFYDVILDPASGRAFAILFSWYSTEDGVRPYLEYSDFMYSSLLQSLEEVG